MSTPSHTTAASESAHADELEASAVHAGMLGLAKMLKQSGLVEDSLQLLATLVTTAAYPPAAYRLISDLLKNAMYERVLQYPQARPYNSRDYALAEHLALADRSRVEPLCLEHPAAPELAYVSMMRDEQDIVLFNLVWHYNLGVRRFVVIDNLSTDKTVDLVLQFEQSCPDVELLLIRDPVKPRNQDRKVTGACRLAQSVWPDLKWIMLVDADEFVCSTVPLANLLASIPTEVDALVLPKSQYHHASEITESDQLFFEKMTMRQPLTHISPKVIIRPQPDIQISAGNHRIYEGAVRHTRHTYISPTELTMREFRLRSFEQFKQRVITGGKATELARKVDPTAIGGGHWLAHYKRYKKMGDIALHQAFSSNTIATHTQVTINDPMPFGKIMAKWKKHHTKQKTDNQ